MGEWSTYRVTDFILFSRDILESVYETYNEAIWPVQLAFTLLSLVVLLLMWQGRGSRAVSLIVAAAWTFTGAVFHWRYFQSINWAAVYFLWLFLFESALLLYFGVIKGALKFSWPRRFVGRLGLGLFLVSVVIPMQGLAFGWGPDHTALGTLGLLLCASGSRIRVLMLLPPILWLVISGLIQYGLR